MKIIANVTNRCEGEMSRSSGFDNKKFSCVGRELMVRFRASGLSEEIINECKTHTAQALELHRLIQNEKLKGDAGTEHRLLAHRKSSLWRADGPECLSMRSLKNCEKIVLVLANFWQNPDDFAFVLGQTSHKWSRRPGRGNSAIDISIGIWCLNPALAFGLIEREARSVVLASGTLSPLESFESELGCTFHRKLEARHVIRKSQVVPLHVHAHTQSAHEFCRYAVYAYLVVLLESS